MPPQSPVVDDEYGLEPAKPAAGVTDDKYGLEPASKSTAPQTEAARLGVTPAPGTPPMKPQTETQTEKSTQGGDRGVWSGIKSSLPSVGSMARRLLLGGVDPVSDFETIKGLGNTGENIKAGAASAREVTPQDPNHPILNKINQGISSVVGGTAGALSPLAAVSPVSQRERALKADTGGIWGENILPTAMALTPIAKEVPGRVREHVGGAIHDPTTGEMTKGAEGMSRATGAAVGGATGAGVGSLFGPAGTYAGGGIGATAGGLAGPSMMERLFPEPAARTAARETFARDKTLTEAQEGATKENIARDKRQAAANKTTPNPFPNATPTNVPVGDAPVPTVKPMTPPQTMPIVRTKAEIAAAAAGGEKNAPIIPGGKIVGPEADPLDAKTTYQSYDRPKLVEMAKRGDRNAYLELLRNPAGTDLTQFKYQYGYGAPGNPVYQPKPFRNYDYKGNLEQPKRPLLLGKPTTPAVAPSPNIPTLNFEQPINVPSETPVAPIKPPNVPQSVPRGTQEVAPMQKPALPPEGVPERRPLPGETPERRKATRDIVNDMSIEQLEQDANKPGVAPEDKARMLRNAADLREMRSEGVQPMEKPKRDLSHLTPAQRTKALASGLFNGQRLTSQELELLRTKKNSP